MVINSIRLISIIAAISSIYFWLDTDAVKYLFICAGSVVTLLGTFLAPSKSKSKSSETTVSLKAGMFSTNTQSVKIGNDNND